MAETARVLPLVRAGEGPRRATLLGAFRLSTPTGANLTPRARKTRALLAYLLLAPGPVPRERLAALLWGDRGDEQAKASLRQALYELRDLATGPDPLLTVERDAVAARPSACELDTERLTNLARNGDLGALATALERANLDLLADLYGVDREFDEWLRAEQVHVLSDALERADPLNEPAVRLGLTADRAAGDLAALHARYRRFAERLRRDLATEPSPETRALLKEGPQLQAAPVPVEATAEPAPAARGRRWLPWIAAMVLALVVAVSIGWGWSRYVASPTSPSLAVLPFKGGAREVYFGAGVSEAVLDLLGRDRDLKVVGSATARQLGAGGDPLRAARRLGVDYLLQGETVAAGGRTDVTARLVRVRDSRVIWTRSYQRPAEDIFAVQSEVAAAVAERLGAQIAARQNPRSTTAISRPATWPANGADRRSRKRVGCCSRPRPWIPTSRPPSRAWRR